MSNQQQYPNHPPANNQPYNPGHLNGCPAQRSWTPYSECRCPELIKARGDRGLGQFDGAGAL